MSIGLFAKRFPSKRLAVMPLLILALAAGSFWLTASARLKCDAVIVENAVALRSGDGEGFDPVAKFDAADGWYVEVVGERGDWVKVRTINGQAGWVPKAQVERIAI